MPLTCTRVRGMTSFISRDDYIRRFLNPFMGPLARKLDLCEMADALTEWTPEPTNPMGARVGSPTIVVKVHPSWVDALTVGVLGGAPGCRYETDDSPASVRAHVLSSRFPELGNDRDVIDWISRVQSMAEIVLDQTGPRRGVPFTVVD